MTRISAKSLPLEIQKKLFTEFSCAIACVNKKNAGPFLEALLSPTEQVMLAKRVGAVLLLHRNVPMQHIVKKLNMSSETIVRMRTSYRNGSYDSIIKLFYKNKKEGIRFQKILEMVLYGVLPSRVGMGRYTFLK